MTETEKMLRWLDDLREGVTNQNHAAEQIVRTAMKPVKDLGEPPCDCIERIGGSWCQECYCQNNGDLAAAQAWCTEANIREAQHD